MAFRMRFNWRRTLFFFMILAFPLLVMNIVGKYKEEHTPPEKRIEKMSSIISKAGGSLSLKEIRDVINQYAALPEEYASREDVEKMMEKVRSSYVDFWQVELERRREENPKEYYKVTLGKDGKTVFLKGDFSSDEIEGFRRSMGWLRALKVMGFEKVVVEGPSGPVTLLLKSKESK